MVVDIGSLAVTALLVAVTNITASDVLLAALLILAGGMAGIMLVVTWRDRAQTAPARFSPVTTPEATLARVIDSLPDAIIVIGRDGRVGWANARVESLLGVDRALLDGAALSALAGQPEQAVTAHLGFTAPALAQLAQAVHSGQWDAVSPDAAPAQFERLTRDGGHVARTMTVIRGVDGSPDGILLIFRDVTEVHQQHQARHDFGGMIVHDLRGPLTAITTSLKLMHEIVPPDAPSGDAVSDTTQSAMRAVRKLSFLIDSLRDVSHLDNGSMALERDLAYLGALCESTLNELGPVAQELEITVDLALPDDLPLLYVDADKIERLLMTLVDGAIKSTPSGGAVAIEAFAPASSSEAARDVRVQIRDSGAELSDDQKTSLFDRYALMSGRAGRQRGTALGLIYCKVVVEAHSGRIWAEDDPAGGTIIAFTLPVARLDALDDATDDIVPND